MATASKSRRPVMVTPPRQTKASSSGGAASTNTYTVEERQQLLDNFDLEVDDKIRSFESHLALTLQSFVLRQDSELFRIPRELRTMTLRDLQANWGGSLAGTVMKLKRDRIEVEERARLDREEEERKAREKEAKGKRKLEEGDGSPGRTSKNARKNASTSKGTTKRKVTTSKKGKSAPTRLSSSQPSGLPQDHIFNPLLPPTPKMPRPPRRGESFLSVNGSPLAHDPHDEDEEEDQDDDDDDDDDDGELPDPEAYAAKMTSKSTRKPAPAPQKQVAKGKRAPSLMIRHSLAPARAARHDEDVAATDGLASVALKDGRVISFNPLDLDPGRIEAEMRESGLGDQDREEIRARIKEEVVKALSERMERWSGMG